MLATIVAAYALAEPPLFSWARERGGHVHGALTIDEGTAKLPRSLRVTRDIAEGECLVTLTEELQLGVEVLGESSAALSLPDSKWAPRLAYALSEHRRRGLSSPFSPYVEALPRRLSNAFAPQPDGFGSSPSERFDAAPGLAPWPPTAERCRGMRSSLRSTHARLEAAASANPPEGGTPAAAATDTPLPTFEQLCWAAAIVSSRAYRVRGAPGERAGDAARLLPVIDLANYAPSATANAELRNAGEDGAGGGAEGGGYGVGLYSSRTLCAGEEVLIDYGNGLPLSSERLLLEYGFGLEGHEEDELRLPTGAISVGLGAAAEREAAAEGAAAGGAPPELSPAEQRALEGAQSRLMLRLAEEGGGSLEGRGIGYLASGAPDEHTLAFLLLLTAQSPSELEGRETVAELAGTSDEAHLARAALALRAIASAALQEANPSLAAAMPGLGLYRHGSCLRHLKRRQRRKRRATALERLEKERLMKLDDDLQAWIDLCAKRRALSELYGRTHDWVAQAKAQNLQVDEAGLARHNRCNAAIAKYDLHRGVPAWDPPESEGLGPMDSWRDFSAMTGMPGGAFGMVVSDVYSFPLTAAYAARLANVGADDDGHLRLLVLGPEVGSELSGPSEACPLLAAHWATLLGGHALGANELTVVFVGPDAPTGLGGGRIDESHETYLGMLHTICIKGAWHDAEVQALLPEDFRSHGPDLAIAFDSGLAEHAPSWVPTLWALRAIGVPFACTSYHEPEAELDARTLVLRAGFEEEGLVCAMARNPLASKMPHLDELFPGRIYVANAFLTVWSPYW